MDAFIKNLIKTEGKLKEDLPETKRYFYYELRKVLEKKPPAAIMLVGFRGIGKTTALLQLISKNAVYFSADNIGFREYNLYDTVNTFYNQHSKRIFFIDEIHTYENWQQEIKNLFDENKDIKIVLSGSASLVLKKTGAGLSRRLRVIETHPLYLHEFVEFKTGIKPKRFSLNEVLKEPLNKAIEIEKQFPNIYQLHQEFMQFGALPLYFQDPDVFPLIMNAIRKIVYVDIPSIYDISYKTVKKLESLILFLAKSSPGLFSYESVSKALQMSKGATYEAMQALQDTGLISAVSPYSKSSLITVRKTPKIYFSHPGIRNAVLKSAGEETNIGAYREEYLYHHLLPYADRIGYPIKEKKKADFLIKAGKKKFLLGVGKHTKKKPKTINIIDSEKAKYPLYLFGFLK